MPGVTVCAIMGHPLYLDHHVYWWNTAYMTSPFRRHPMGRHTSLRLLLLSPLLLPNCLRPFPRPVLRHGGSMCE